ncbi:hypothetical protein A2U01_0074920, partial [Trifolium medium]|nr:hypothetical protein [Trifolium medium]
VCQRVAHASGEKRSSFCQLRIAQVLLARCAP